MSDDEALMKRLRDNVTEWLYQAEDDGRGYINDAPFEAADAIERLTRERDDCREDYRRESKIAAGYAAALFRAERKIEKLREAIEVFAERAAYYDPIENDDDEHAFVTRFTIGDLRRARAALAETEERK